VGFTEALRREVTPNVAVPLYRLRSTAVLSLATRLTGSRDGGVLTDALDHLFGTTQAKSGVACTVSATSKIEIVAEHGLAGPAGTSRLREAAIEIVGRAVKERSTFCLLDVRSDRQGLALAGEIASVGCTAALATPLDCCQRTLGALLLLFPPYVNIDTDTIRFVETVAKVLALALQSESQKEPAPAAHFDPLPRGHAGVALVSASVAREIEGPVAALALQLEEQKRLVSELELLSGDGDTAVGGTTAEIAELTDELTAAVIRLRQTADQLGRIGGAARGPETIDLSELAREACSLLRPQLEQRGVLLDSQLVPAAYVIGRRDLLSQVLCELVVLAGNVAENSHRAPRVLVRTHLNGSRVLLSIDDVGPDVSAQALSDLARRPIAEALPEDGRYLVLKLAGDVAASCGGHVELVPAPGGGAICQLILPVPGSLDTSDHAQLPDREPTSSDVIRQVLVVDDDPVFTRAVRRALRPHFVKESATASEAEILLLDGSYAPDLVICDLMLPGADGTVLHRRVRDARAQIARRFLFVTGGTLGKEAADYIRDSGCGALRKPINLGTIRRHLSEPLRDSVTSSIVRTLRGDPITG